MFLCSLKTMPMNGWLLLIPFICAGLGWAIHRLAIAALFYPVQPRRVLGLPIQGLLPRRQEQLAAQVGALAGAYMPNAASLEAMITRPEHFKKLMPVIEEQIDHFLRVKLKQSMPVVGMFVGDKTIGQLKAVFVTELESIFPTVMKNYAASLAGEFDAKRLITEKLSSIPPETLVKEVRDALEKELSMLLWLGAISGFCAGVLAVVLMVIIH
jgi:uncharacterized membrane protein YheB (UPF0754 family)